MKRPLLFYFSSEILLSLGIGLAGYGQPFFYQNGGMTDAQIGILFAVSSAASGLFALLLGPVADRVGASKLFKVATLLTGLGFLCTAATSGFVMWCLSAALSGLGSGLLMSTENVVLSSLSSSREKAGILSRFVSLYMLLIGIGTVAAGWVSVHYGYQMTLWAAGVLGVGASAIRVFVTAPDAKSHRMFRVPSKQIALMSFYAVLFGVALGVLRPFTTLILHGNFALTNQVTSAVSAGTLFMTSIGSLLVSPLLRRLRHGRTLGLGFVLSTLVTLEMAFTQNAWFFSGALLARTILTSVPGPIVDSTFLELTPETEYAQMFGVRVFGNSAGNAVGAYGGGILMNLGAVSGLLIVSAVFLVGSCGYLFWLLRHVRQRRERSMPNESGTPVTLSQPAWRSARLIARQGGPRKRQR